MLPRISISSALLLLAAALCAAAPVLDVSDDRFRFAVFPGKNPPPKFFRIIDRGDGTLKPTVTVPAEYAWLKVSLAGLAGAISIESSQLAEGNYQGSFVISDPAAADAPREIEVKLHVTRVVITEPERLDLFLPAGQSGFRDVWLPVQSVPSGVLPDYQARTETGEKWLDLRLLPEAGIYLRATVSGTLKPGIYSGSIEFEHGGRAAGRVPVSVTVTDKAILAVDRERISEQTSPGLDPPDEWISVRNQGTGPMDWTAAPRPGANGNWLRASREGDAIRVSFIPTEANLAPGRYTWTVEVRSPTAANSPLVIPVELRVLERGRAALKFGGAVDAANYCDRVNCYLAAGSLATLFGSQLAYGPAMASKLPLPDKLGSTRVLVNGAPAELLYVSYGQVNFRLPDKPPPGGRWFIVAERDGQPSVTITARYTPSAPAVFTANQSGKGYGAILLAGAARLADAANPAPRGSYVEIYATGLGPPAAGKPTVLFYGPGIVGNIEGEASYAGPAPGFPGLNQINVQLPASLPAGDHIRLQVRTPFNLLSNSVEIAVR